MNKPRRFIRWLTRFGLLAGALLLLVALFLLVERFRGERALSHRLAALSRQGEALSVTALAPKAVPPNQNAFLLLASLTNREEAILTNLYEGPPLLKFVHPGQAQVSWRLNRWQADENLSNDWSRFDPEMEQARDLLALLHAAAGKPRYDSGFDYQKGFLDFRMGPLYTTKEAAQVLSATVLYDLHRHQSGEAYSNLVDLVNLVGKQAEPLVICQLVRQACAVIAFEATWQALQSDGWNDAQLAALQSAWKQSRFSVDMGRAMDMERDLTIAFYHQLRVSNRTFAQELRQRENASAVFGDLFGPLPARGFLLHWFYGPIWRFTWSAQDELRAVNRWQVMIERERLAQKQSWAALSSDLSPKEEAFGMVWPGPAQRMNWYDRLRYLFSSEALSVNDGVIRRAFLAQTLERLVTTAIAIERYRQAYGVVPKDLGLLVPKYLSEVPIDCMDGKALRYRATSKTEFLLYSVGENGVDDGGDPSPEVAGTVYRGIWDGKDAVWPSPVNPASASDRDSGHQGVTAPPAGQSR